MALYIFERKWLRRLLLFLLGLTLSHLYFTTVWDEILLTPFAFGLVIGVLSGRPLEACINSLIVLIAMIVLILVEVIAANMGGAVITLEYYGDVIATSFVSVTLLFVTWTPGAALGLIARYFVLKLDKHNRLES